MMPEAAPARRRRSARWPSEGEARPAGAMPARPAWRPCSWLASACSALPPGAVGLSGQTPNFGFRIPDFKIENSVFESGVSSPVPGHARIRMRVSVCAYPGAGAGEGVPAALRAPVLTGGFSVWLALAYGVCSVAFAVWPQAHSGEASALAQWPIRPGAVRTGRERERKRAQTVWRGGFRRGRVRPTPIPPGRLLTSDCRGSASPRGDSALAATSAGSSGQSAWAWSAAADSAFRAPLAPVWPKAIARQAPMGLGSALWPLGFGTWPWRCRLCPFLLSSPLHLAQARLGAQAPRCPGVQVSRCPGAADATGAPGAWGSGPRPACPGPLALPHPFPSGSALVRLPQAIAPPEVARRA